MTMIFDVKVHDDNGSTKYTITNYFDDKLVSVEQISAFLSDWHRQKIATGVMTEHSFIWSWLAKYEDNVNIA